MLDQEFLGGGIGASAMAKLQAWAASGTGANAKAFLAEIAAGSAALDQKVIPAPAVVRTSQARAEVEFAPSHLLHQARTEHHLARSEAQLQEKALEVCHRKSLQTAQRLQKLAEDAKKTAEEHEKNLKGEAAQKEKTLAARADEQKKGHQYDLALVEFGDQKELAQAFSGGPPLQFWSHGPGRSQGMPRSRGADIGQSPRGSLCIPRDPYSSSSNGLREQQGNRLQPEDRRARACCQTKRHLPATDPNHTDIWDRRSESTRRPRPTSCSTRR